MLILFGLVFVLNVVFAVYGVVGLIAPKVYRNKKTGNVPGRLSSFLTGIILTSLSFALLTYLSTQIQHAGRSEVVSASANRNAAPSATSLGLTASEFHDAFNAAIGRYNKNYKIADFEVRTGGAQPTFLYQLSKDLLMQGTIDTNDANVDGVTLMVFSPSGSEEEQRQILTVLLATTEALNPDIPVEENKKIVMDVFHESIVNFNSKVGVQRIVGDLTYSSITLEYTGLWFVITKSNKS